MNIALSLFISLLCRGYQTICSPVTYDPVGEKSKNRTMWSSRSRYRSEGLMCHARYRDCHWHAAQPQATWPLCGLCEKSRIARKYSRLPGTRETIVLEKSSPGPGSDYRHVAFFNQDWVEWMPANGFTSGASGRVGKTCLSAPASKAPHASFSRSPVSGRRYTLPKLN